MSSVFILEHLHVHTDGEECWKRIGVYTTYGDALSAIDRMKVQPGFADYPHLIDDNHSPCGSGFNIDEYELNQDHWQEGFFTTF